MAPHLEPRRTLISTGHVRSNQIESFSLSSPFVHQARPRPSTSSKVDVVMPAAPEIEDAFRQLETVYYTARTGLVALFDSAQEPGVVIPPQKDAENRDQAAGHTSLGKRKESSASPPPPPSPSPFLHALSTPRHLPDAWDLVRDTSLTLNLSAGKATFEEAGIRGKRVREAFRGCEEQYQETVNLCRKGGASVMRAALDRWDQTRHATGQGEWEFSYYTEDPDKAAAILSPQTPARHHVRPTVRTFADVRVPAPRLAALRGRERGKAAKKRKLASGAAATATATDAQTRDSDDADADADAEAWFDDMGALFEWVGMAALGAQRLRVNDRADPYVAVYDPPEPSTVGDVVHFQWRGLLNPDFVQSILDCAVNALDKPGLTGPFIAFTAHRTPYAPPMLVPREEGEDTCTIVLVPDDSEVVAVDGGEEDEARARTKGRWAMVESVGQWNARRFG
ncbi:hypothetical protein HETIRDRAFT_459892 [Heterobasidion irregulare TC 32-1]|uniref:Uncharacterized protein n=1 Tax=Heterobasidion irregulare (strain TC 32-1) TaxID=747525 RepID=W4JYN7_HETIT|nr:uncharacterized protein HETIRDRAFT_459892 [Heterobasidion irregulare TC 32-1]ETW78663.1 hypothetical protein HETIRDRAFT_459892 [Heterobasidion irregulare TC 32-1]